MQDNEFDKLFSSKLEDLEIEPSGEVWQGINENLGGKKRKSLIPVLSIAACILVLVTAGIMLVAKKDGIVKSPVKNRIAVTKPLKVTPRSVNKHIATEQKTIQLADNKPVRLYHPGKTDLAVKLQKKEPVHNNLSPAPNITQLLAATASTKEDVKQPNAPDTAKLLVSTLPVQQSEKFGPVNASLPPVEKTTDTAPVKKHKIHGIGDLLNVAIAAVDKRRDKIIEFSDNDGDGTSISSVNLGIIKVKKEN